MNRAADARTDAVFVLKDEPAATVVVRGAGADAVVEKTYRNRGLRWLQSMCRRSRAQREHDHLAAITAAGIPCLQPVRWAERRRLLGVDESLLVTRLLPDATSLKAALQAMPPTDRTRGRLAESLGGLLAAMHRAGFLWCTPMPRNVLVVGDLAHARLAVCDTPACVPFRGSIHGGRRARIDLFLAAFSPSRRRDWSAVERLRLLCGYSGGDRAAARKLWRTLARRRPLQNVVERALAMATFTYILAWIRPRPHPPTPAR
ncbi:MAG: phosphotransferase [Planctomycetes bacterium]|nr:phosphotransferase [Planctomycetota bacterium]